MKTRIFTTLIAIVLFTFSQAQNNALSFAGGDDLVTTSLDPNMNVWTVECWVLGGSAPSSSNIERILDGGYNFCINWGHNNADFRGSIEFYNDASSSEYITEDAYVPASFGTLNAGEWYHLAGTYDGMDLKAYKNGILITNNGWPDGDPKPETKNITIGASGVSSNPFSGKIDEVRIWNDVRTEEEIRTHMYQELDAASEANLVAYYKMNSTSGTTAVDSKNNYDGTLTNMSNSWLPSPAFFGPKNCLDFDGSNEWISTTVTMPSTYTKEAWVYIADLSKSNNIISGGTNVDAVLWIPGWLGSKLSAGHSGNFNIVEDSEVFPLGSWQHVAVTYGSGTMTLYRNGIQVDQASGVSAVTGEYDVEIGSYSGDNFLSGKLDEVRIWNDVRTEDEIREYMCKSLTGNEANLIAYYNFDNSSGTALQDLSGNGNDGTLVNMDNSDWVSSSAFNTWLNTSSDNSATVTNWSRGATPTSSDNVGIYNFSGSDPVISSSFDCNNFYLESGASFTMNDGASFIANGNEFINGTFTINKTISESSKWHLISVPNNNTTTTEFIGFYLQEWDEITSNWYDISEQGIAMPPCKGYGLWDVPAKNTFSFSGTPNTGEQSISIYSNSSVEDTIGMNLIGNPYPSAIDWATLDGEIYGAVYIWDPATDDYKSYNNEVGDVRYIAPAQGFFIHATENGTFNIGNNSRTHEGASTFYKSTSSQIENGLVLSTNQRDKLFIRFMDEAYDDFDFEYDAFKIVSLANGNSQIYSKYFDTKLAIDCRPETDIIQLGYQNNQNGNYSIEIVESDDITTEIEDTKLNIFHDLTKGAYGFNWNTSDSEERFILHLKATGTEELNEQDVQVYAANGQVYVRMDETSDFNEIMLYDLAGRLVFKSHLNQQSLQSFNLGHLQGAYLVQLISADKTLVSKILLE